MATSVSQDEKFVNEINSLVEVTVNSCALEIAIEFIGKNFDPEDIFTEKQLSTWAEDNGYTKD